MTKTAYNSTAVQGIIRISCYTLGILLQHLGSILMNAKYHPVPCIVIDNIIMFSEIDAVACLYLLLEVGGRQAHLNLKGPLL